MKRIIIGVVGPIASGKGYLADYLKGRGFFALTLSDRIREEADRRGLPRTRDNLVAIGNEWRHEFGLDILAKKSLALVTKQTKLIVIEGIRNPGEIAFLKDFWGALIVGVDAPEELRLRLYLERAKLRGEDTATEDEFWRVNDRDLGKNEDKFGQQGKACFEMADVKLENDGTDKFLTLFESVLRRLKGGAG